MFTGIIEETGTVTQIDDLGGGKRLTIEAEMALALQVDQSVSINGACQTVVFRRVSSIESAAKVAASGSTSTTV